MQLLTPYGLLVAVANAQYALQSSFSGLTFFENFEFYTSWDPTYGYVHYVDQAFAQQNGMINITNTSVSFGVDATQMLNPSANLGRLSLRLVTLQSWTHGLFILDLAHMPSNTCGVWPAVWMLGSGLWPTNGEIDIIEYVNNGANDLMALHTSPGCSVAGADETGSLVTSDCGAGAGFTGCTVSATQLNNSGDAFNANGGGVYAWEWTSTAIRIWFFTRNAIPPSIISGVPDVNTFGIPTANFEGSCDIDAHFYNASILFNVDFCGSYAGNAWQANGCPMLDPENGWSSRNTFVALNPSAFEQTFWEVNYLKVYQAASGALPTTTSILSSVTPAINTSSAVSTALSGALGRTTSPTMSLAGTTPTITPGTWTDTSSVLSVLSSLSSESKASVSSTSPALPFTSISTSSTAIATVPSTWSSTTSPVVLSLPPTSSTAACTGPICTSNVYVTVVSTITVGVNTPRALAATTSYLRIDENSHEGIQFDRCRFEIFPSSLPENPWTEFACTLTREEIFNGELVTKTLIASTPLQSGTALQFGDLLSIDRITMKTAKADCITHNEDQAFTGSFTPSGTYVSSTTLTALPVSTLNSNMHVQRPSGQPSDRTRPVSLVKRGETSGASTTSTGADNSAKGLDKPYMPLIGSLLVAIVFRA